MALTVNGEGITLVDFDAEVARYIAAQDALGKPVSSTDATSVVIEDLIAQMLLAQGARTNGFTLDDSALQSRVDSLAAQIGGVEVLSKWQAEHGYSEQAFRSALKRGAESAWMRDKIVTALPSTVEQVHVQQILLYNEGTAQSFLAQLNGGADFDELALEADPLTWRCFQGLMLIALLRVLGEFNFFDPAMRAALLIISAFAWLAVFIPWGLHYVPIYLRPRADAKPG